MTNNYQQLSQSLKDNLQLTLTPVAIWFTDEKPSDSKSAPPVAAGCSFWEKGAQGTFTTTPKDHASCAIGTYTHNLEGTPAHEKDRGDAIAIFAQLGYLPPSELASIPVLEKRSSYVVYGPLSEATAEPAVVMLFVKASQSLVVSEAVFTVDGGSPLAMGRPACAVVPQVINHQKAALSLGCCGARAYLDALTDDVALFALPGAKLAAYAERLDVLTKANKTLSAFHQIRRKTIESGKSPTILESLAELQSSPN
jgi:uncharacterized protein (DUF169 family)